MTDKPEIISEGLVVGHGRLFFEMPGDQFRSIEGMKGFTFTSNFTGEQVMPLPSPASPGEEFEARLLHHIGQNLGLTYEQLVPELNATTAASEISHRLARTGTITTDKINWRNLEHVFFGMSGSKYRRLGRQMKTRAYKQIEAHYKRLVKRRTKL